MLKVSVSAEEADNYAILWNTDNGLSAPDCCDKDNFRYDVLGSPKSPWNRSAARVFVKAFEEWAGVELDQETTMEAVATWIKSLRQARRQSLLSRTQQEQEKCRARRQGRKRSVECFFDLHRVFESLFYCINSFFKCDLVLLSNTHYFANTYLYLNDWGWTACLVMNQMSMSPVMADRGLGVLYTRLSPPRGERQRSEIGWKGLTVFTPSCVARSRTYEDSIRDCEAGSRW